MTQKKCKTCGVIKTVDQFRSSVKNGKRYYLGSCRECRRQTESDYQARWYRNLSTNKKRARRRKQLDRRLELRRLMYLYLLENPCVDCGESDPVVLEFDHVKDDKSAVISRMMANNLSWAKVRTEIEKCQVRCANCHRRVTAKRTGFWRHVFGGENAEKEEVQGDDSGRV